MYLRKISHYWLNLYFVLDLYFEFFIIGWLGISFYYEVS